MLFNSYIFIFAFLPITFFLYFYLNSLRLTYASKAFLVLASLFFYSWWNINYLPLILLSMFFNYTFGRELTKKKESRKISKKTLLAIGILGNIALLGYFKYADFFISNINYIFNSDIPPLHIALPLAISFFTFQQIAYLVDSYKGLTKEYDLLTYALFVTFFPQLIAGPIVHHKEMMPQFAKLKNKIINYSNIAAGLFIFSIGLFKKVIIADTFAIWANAGFDVAQSLNMLQAWATSLSYTFQLYFDFSGYTDMAIGAALLFNIKLPINFNSPYKSLNIQEFWRRWHITLSRFLKEYIYIPLGGNRAGELRTYINLMITFLIGGIWHGAGWTFVFWGFLHGLALIVYKIWNKIGFKLPKFIAWLITFNFINIAWIFFRAKEWDDAMKVLKNMFDGAFILPQVWQSKLTFLSNIKFAPYSPTMFYWILGGFIIVLFLKNSNELTQKFKPTILSALYAATLFLVAASSLSKVSEFLYFNF